MNANAAPTTALASERIRFLMMTCGLGKVADDLSVFFERRGEMGVYNELDFPRTTVTHVTISGLRR